MIHLISIKYSGKGNIEEYIIQMSHPASKLNVLELVLSEKLLVHLVLVSFPIQFTQFKVSYNSQKETWSLNELISQCVKKEKRLKQDQTESAHMISITNNKSKGHKRKNDKNAVGMAPQKTQ